MELQYEKTPRNLKRIIKPPKEKDMNKDQYNKTKDGHKAEIAKIKELRAKLKKDIKRHKLLMKQAKITYKLSKMKEK